MFVYTIIQLILFGNSLEGFIMDNRINKLNSLFNEVFFASFFGFFFFMQPIVHRKALRL